MTILAYPIYLIGNGIRAFGEFGHYDHLAVRCTISITNGGLGGGGGGFSGASGSKKPAREAKLWKVREDEREVFDACMTSAVGQANTLGEAIALLEQAAAPFEEWAPLKVWSQVPKDTARVEELVLELQQLPMGQERRVLARRIFRARRARRRAEAKRKEAEEAMTRPRSDKQMGVTRFD